MCSSMNIKKLAKKITSLSVVCCVGAAMSLPLAPLPSAAAGGGLGGVLAGIGAGVASMSAQKKALRKELDYINDTEEGRQKLFAEYKEKYGVNYDYELNARADALMADLSRAVAASDPSDTSIKEKPYLYFVNNSEEINAFCSLGHVVSINTGILKAFPNDDEIAVVVGHEMGHGQKNHAYKGTLGRADKQMTAAVLGSAVGGAAGSLVGNIVGNLTLIQSVAHGTKANEKEADDLAFEYITHSNYNPGACAAVWQRFIDMYGNNAQGVAGSVFSPSDHPNHGARRDKYVKMLEDYSGKHATAADGMVLVNGKNLVAPKSAGGMSGAERSYFVLGNLAAAYHNGHSKSEAYVKNGTVMLGAQPIITPVDGDESADAIASRLNSIK